MKITHIANMSMGGICRLVTDLANEQHNQKHIVRIVSPIGRENFLRNELHPNIRFENGGIKSGFSLNIPFYWSLARALKNVDIIHIHAFNILLILCLRLHRIPCIYTEHGTFQRKHQINSIKNVIKKRLLGRTVLRYFVGGIAFNSEWMKLNSALKNRNQKIVYNGIPNTNKVFARQVDETNGCISVGRLEPKKRVSRLIDIITNIQDVRIQFHVLGSGTQMNPLIKRAKKQTVKQDIVFHGSVRNPGSYYQKAKVFLLGSKDEPFGLVVLEAIRFGCLPLIFADSGGAVEILQDDFHELICRDEHDMQMKLTYWITHDRERLRTVEKLQDSILVRFSTERMAYDYLNFYKTII